MSKIQGPFDDERYSGQARAVLEQDKLYTEQEAIQEEISYRIPGSVKLLLQYEWKPIVKVLMCIIAVIGMYFLFGWDSVAAAIAIYIFATVMVYVIQSKNMNRDSTLFVEMKLAGQKIPTGDHSPYSKTFYTTESGFRIWEVPNVLMKNGMFKMPSDQSPSMMPGTGRLVFCDFFDRQNRTCVLPRDMDVANIALATNANPMTANKLNRVAEEVLRIKEMEKTAYDLYSTGNLSAEHAASLLRPIAKGKKILLDPTREKKRDIFFELQGIVPEMRERLQEVSNKIFLLADFMSARTVYQLINRPMPEEVKKDHDLVYKLMGVPELISKSAKLGIERPKD